MDRSFSSYSPIVAFILGVAVTETFKQPRFVSVLPDTSRIVLLLEIVVLIIVGFLPSSVPNMLVTVTISFVAALQVSSFRTLIKWSYNTTMTTGNLRTASQAAYYAIFKRDENAAYQCLRFTAIILFFERRIVRFYFYFHPRDKSSLASFCYSFSRFCHFKFRISKKPLKSLISKAFFIKLIF
ncbi:DUF1275 domain-containing protein [Priestia sp. OVL9]|nr:DUF1275 domain-containing protein [Priestia sp. OVL9]